MPKKTPPNERHLADFARELKALRRQAGLTQVGLAAIAGISDEHLAKLERGLSGPSFSVLCSLASALKTEPGRLLGAGWPEAERRKPSRALRESRDILQSLMRLNQDMLFILEPDMTIVDLNESAARSLGLARENLIGRPLADFLPPKVIASRQAMADQVLASGRAGTLVDTRGGRVIECLVQPITGESGRPYRLAVHARDATENKRLMDRLTDSEARYLSLTRNFQGIAFRRGLDFRPVYYHGAVEAITGYGEADLNGGRIAWDSLIHPEDRAAMNADPRHKALKVLTNFALQQEYRILRKDGAVRWIFEALHNACDGSGRPAFVEGVLIDITERRAMQEEIELSADRHRRLFDSLPDPAFILDMQGGIVQANTAALRHLECRREDLSGRGLRDFAAEASGRDFTESLLQMARRGKASFEMALRDRSGGVSIVEVNATLHDMAGEQVILALCRDLTARRAAESERNILRQAIEQSSASIVITDTAGTILYVNPAFSVITGYSQDEARGQNPRILKSGLHDEGFYQDLWRTISGGSSWFGEFHNRDKHGRLYWESARISPIMNSAGAVTHYVAVKDDITELKRKESMIRRHLDRLNSLMQLIMTPWRDETQLTDFAVDEMVRLSGSDVGYLRLGRAEDVDLASFTWSSRAREQCEASMQGKYGLEQAGIWADSLRTGKPALHNDYAALGRSGRLPQGHIPLRRHMSVPILDKGEVVAVAGVGNRTEPYDEFESEQLKLFASSLWEIVQRRRGESRLSQAHDEFLAVLQNLDVGVCVVDAAGSEIVFINRHLQNIFSQCGLHERCMTLRGELPDRRCREFRLIVDMALEGFGPGAMPREWRDPASGSWYLLHRRGIRWIDGSSKVLVLLSDINAFKEAERLREEIENITRHDLKTPLNGILGMAQLLSSGENLTPSQKHYVRLIEDSGLHMLDFINQSLSLYRIEEGTYSFEPEPVSLTALVRRVRNDLGRLLRAKNLDMDIRVNGHDDDGSSEVTANADSLLCYSILANLVKNAAEASPQNETVRVDIEAGDACVRVHVCNQGTIPDAVRPRFGQKHVTAGKSKGTGLGVYSARLMAEAQNGSLDWTSTQAEGTCITVTLGA